MDAVAPSYLCVGSDVIAYVEILTQQRDTGGSNQRDVFGRIAVTK